MAIDLDAPIRFLRTAFLPDDRGMLRISVSNADQAQIADFALRLAAVSPPAG